MFGHFRHFSSNLQPLTLAAPWLPLQVGSILGELVAVGGVDLKVVAEHIRTADANPDDLQASPGSLRPEDGWEPGRNMSCFMRVWPLALWVHALLLLLLLLLLPRV